jgi:hypothetical protein
MSKVHWRGVYRGARVLVALLCDGYEGSLPRRRVWFPDWVGAGLKKGGRRRGITPRLSGDETRQAVEQHGEDRLIGGAGRQVYLDLGFQFDDTGGEFD